jgi:hypothetical protein
LGAALAEVLFEGAVTPVADVLFDDGGKTAADGSWGAATGGSSGAAAGSATGAGSALATAAWIGCAFPGPLSQA